MLRERRCPIIRGHCPGELALTWALQEVKPRKWFDNEPHYAQPSSLPVLHLLFLSIPTTALDPIYIYINSAAFSIFRFQFTNPREPSLLGANLVLFVAWNLSGPRRKGGTTTFAFSRRRVTRWFSSHLNMKLEKERRGEEGNVWWGKQVTISGGGTMRGIVRPVRIRRAPSVGQWSSMRIYRSWRTGWPCKREISHPSHGVEGFFFKEGVAHFARKRRKTYMLFLPRIFRLEFLQRNATRSLVTGNGAMKRRKPKCMMHTLYVGQKCKGLFWLTSPFLEDRVFDWWDWPRLVRGCTFSYYVNKA